MDEAELPHLPSVLTVDDEIGLREMLTFALTGRGYRVVSAADGDEAIEKVRKEPFDLVVCDVMMPGKGGIEVLKMVKQIRPEIQVIMATGYPTTETTEESMKQGAYDLITKPYCLDHLCALFEKILEMSFLECLHGSEEEVTQEPQSRYASNDKNGGHLVREGPRALHNVAGGEEHEEDQENRCEQEEDLRGTEPRIIREEKEPLVDDRWERIHG